MTKCRDANLKILKSWRSPKLPFLNHPKTLLKVELYQLNLRISPTMLKNCQNYMYLQTMHFPVYQGDLVIYTRDWEFWSVSGIVSDNMTNRILILLVKEKMREQEIIFIVPACCYEKDLQLFFLRKFIPVLPVGLLFSVVSGVGNLQRSEQAHYLILWLHHSILRMLASAYAPVN